MQQTRVSEGLANGLEYNSAIGTHISHKSLKYNIVVFLCTQHGTVV